MRNEYPAFKDGDMYIRIREDGMRLSRTRRVDYCSTFKNKRAARSWERFIKSIYPKARMVMLRLVDPEEGP